MAAIHYYDGTGDINYDGDLNIMDIIQIVNIIINQNDIDLSEGEFEIIDGDDDQNINIMDIIYFINIIIN